MMPLRYQFLGNLVVGILASLLLRAAFTPQQSEIERKSQPFTTHSGMLMISLLVHKDSPPEILEVQTLESGRVTVLQPGDYTMSMLDENGTALYTTTFQVVFIRPGDPPKLTDQVYLTVVVPASEEARKITLSGPTGDVERDLSQD